MKSIPISSEDMKRLSCKQKNKLRHIQKLALIANTIIQHNTETIANIHLSNVAITAMYCSKMLEIERADHRLFCIDKQELCIQRITAQKRLDRIRGVNKAVLTIRQPVT